MDIARRAGVSITTVSRVLNKDTTISVSERTSRAIFEAAFELNYLPPRKRHAAKDQTLRVGVADWHVLPEGYPNIRLSALQYLAEVMTLSNPLSFIRLTRGEAQPLDGILAFGDYDQPDIDRMLEMTRRIVFVNTGRVDFTFDRVEIEHETGIREALCFLAKRSGQSVAVISGIYSGGGTSIGVRRTQTVTDLMRQMGLYDERRVWVGDYSQESGAEMARGFLGAGLSAPSLIVTSDVVASGVLGVLREEAPSLLSTLHPVIYRDMDSVRLPDLPFSTIQMYSDLVWQKAIQMLIEQINGRMESVRTVIPSRFVPFSPGSR